MPVCATTESGAAAGEHHVSFGISVCPGERMIESRRVDTVRAGSAVMIIHILALTAAVVTIVAVVLM